MKTNIITLRTHLNRVPIDYQGQPIIQENEHYREWLLCQDLTEQQAQEWLDEKAAELALAADEPDMIDKGEDYLSYDNKTWKIRTLEEALDMGMMGNMRRNLLRQIRQLLAETLEVEVEEIEDELLTRSHVDGNYHTIYVTEYGELDYHEEDMLIYWQGTSLRRALLDEDVELNAVDRMRDAITTIDWGYFVDEQ